MSALFDPLKIVCLNFTRDEVDALRSLLGLLRSYLKQPWVVATEPPGDLYFLNLDASTGVFPAHDPTMRIVGCALRPRMQRKGTLHRPLRVAEVLAILTDLSGEYSGISVGAERMEWRFRLRAWPLELEHWPAESARVLAYISTHARSVAQISSRVEMAPVEVERCIALLTRMDLIDRLAERRVLPAPHVAAPRWRSLATRVGHVLGFSR